MKALLRQLMNESIVYGCASVLASIVGFILIPIYTRVFQPSEYGMMSLITALSRAVSIFIVLGLDSAAGRWYWDTDETADRKKSVASWFWCQLGMSIVVATAIFAFSHGLSEVITGNAQGSVYFHLIALTLPFSVLEAITTNWLRFRRKPVIMVVYSGACNLMSLLLTVWLVVGLNWGLTGVYLAQGATAFFSTLFALPLLRDWISPLHFDFSRLKEMLRYSYPLIPAGLAFWVVSFADRYFVEYYTNVGEVGLYQVGGSIASIVAVAVGAFLQAWGPFSISIHKKVEANNVYANVFLIYLWVTCFLSAGLSLLAPEMLRIFTTAEYFGAESVVGILALGYVLNGLIQVASIGTTIAKKMMPISAAYIIAAFLNIPLNMLLVPALGKEGSALATLVCFCFMTIYMFYKAQRIYFIPYRFSQGLAVVMFACVVMYVGGLQFVESIWVGLSIKLFLLSLFLPIPFILNVISVDYLRVVTGFWRKHFTRRSA